MQLRETDEKRIEKIREIKRYCLLCVARKDLDPREREKERVLNSLSELREDYDMLYDENRKNNRSSEEIHSALDNKRVCMDAIDLCKKCPKDFDQVNRFMVIDSRLF